MGLYFKPMDVVLALIADAANRSQEGKLNILGAFGEIYATAYPATHPEMQLVLRMEASPGEVGQTKELIILLLDADGQPVENFHVKGTFQVQPAKRPGRKSVMETLIRLVAVTFPKEGDYTFEIMINGESKANIPLNVGPPPSTSGGKGDGD